MSSITDIEKIAWNLIKIIIIIIMSFIKQWQNAHGIIYREQKKLNTRKIVQLYANKSVCTKCE